MKVYGLIEEEFWDAERQNVLCVHLYGAACDKPMHLQCLILNEPRHDKTCFYLMRTT